MVARYSIPCPVCRKLIGIGRYIEPDTMEMPPIEIDPARGDVVVCGGCTELLVFMDSRTLVPVPESYRRKVMEKVGTLVTFMSEAILASKTKQ